ncbi:hypothetical protein BT63DRAFT_102594 [Microthyrium microscopicum]|uniref:Uncharacterized protein n=1 Tax=Microthyrium microscopicum TaxID=703497 RepID=A0A6A6TYD1_9PEZI|nr:hypothetical protein BT63DRAFT_102594 [Microthyrium microscopicum]
MTSISRQHPGPFTDHMHAANTKHYLVPPHFPQETSRHVSSSSSRQLQLPYSPPPLPSPSSPLLSPSNLDKRPSTAPGPQGSQANSDLSASTKAPRSSRPAAIRKSPTVSDLHVSKRPSSSRATVNPSPSLSGLLSPTSANPAQSRAQSRSSSTSERRGSSARRPPASFSANGIETSYGPPPALITRGSYHSELARLAQNPAASTFAAQKQKPYNSGTLPLTVNTSAARSDFSSRPRSRDQSSDSAQQQAQGLLSPTTFEHNEMESLDAIMRKNQSQWRQAAPSESAFDIVHRKMQRAQRQPSEEGIESSQSSEDLFLKLGDEGTLQEEETHRQEEEEIADVTSQLDHLQIRGRRPTERNLLQNDLQLSRRRNSSPLDTGDSGRYSAMQNMTAYRRPSGAASVIGVSTRTSTTLQDRQNIASYRPRYSGPQTPSVVSRASEYTSTNQRRASVADQFPGRSYQRISRLNYSTTPTEQSPKATRSSYQQDPRTDGESVVSTVQSNVWDEMAERKSHVHRIDHGRGYSGAAGSNGSGERPRTATTTITTVSSSPKLPMGFKSTANGNQGGQEASNIHPNLHQSLARCKTTLSPAVYRALETSASGALEMAMAARGVIPSGSVYSSATGTNSLAGDRQMKRKADNLCRNITDLCVALLDDHPRPVSPEATKRLSIQTLGQNRASRDSAQNTPQTPGESAPRTYSRHMSLEPEEREARPASSRALERLEARRASNLGSNSAASSPRESLQTAQQRLGQQEHPKSSPIPSALMRAGTSLRARRAQADDDDEVVSFRAPSRAVTEVGSMLRKRSDRLSSNLGVPRNSEGHYTPQHSTQQSSALRRVVTNGGLPSPTNSTASFARASSRLFGNDRLAPDDAEAEEKKTKRRSLNLYSGSSSNTALGRSASLRPASLSTNRQSLTTAD